MSQKEVDLIIYNAKIYTVDSEFSIVEAFAIKEGRILATGSSDMILSEYIADVNMDANGKVIYPGFFDAHCHFTGYGLNKLSYAELSGTKSFDEILEILVNHNTIHENEWVLGRGWDQNDWTEKQFPTNKKLNELFPDKPVLLLRIDGHAALANDYALQLANVDFDEKVDGGEFIKEGNKLTGLLIDNAISQVRRLVAKPDNDDVRNALLISQENCIKLGLTSVADAGVDWSEIQIMDSLHKSGDLKMNIYAMINPYEKNLKYFSENGPFITNKLIARSIKLYADGALGSRGAKLLEPYSDSPENDGLIVETEEYYNEICELAFNNGFQVNTHAIGDSAVRLMLHTYAKYLKGENDYRWRIEHSQIVDKVDLPLFGKYSIVPSIQGTHATSDMYWAETRIGERIKNAYAYKDLLNQNGWIPNGTDFPVEEIDPLNTYYASVFRKDKNLFPENGFQIENALTPEETLKSMTIWAAKSCFMDSITGSLEPGKYADFILLSNDIIVSNESQVLETKVLETWISGEKVY